MKRILMLIAVALLLTSIIVAKTTPPSDPMQVIGRQIIHAFKQNDVTQLKPLLLDEDGVEFIIDATMESEEMQQVPEEELAFTRSILEATFALGIDQWAVQFAADFDSVRAYAQDVYGIDWGKASILSVNAETTDNSAFVYAGPVQIHFRCDGDDYTLWLQELTQVNGDWRVSGFNLEITSRGADTPVFHENATEDSWDDDSSNDVATDDSWEDSDNGDDDSWEDDPAADPRSKKAQAQEGDDSWE